MGLASLALFGLTAAGVDCRAESVFINLRSEAEVGQADVRLADIAEIATSDKSRAEQLGNAVVARCASLAQPCRLGKADVVPAVQSQATQLGASVIWGSNDTVTIKGLSRPLSLAPAIDRAAIRMVQAMYRGYPLAVSVKEAPSSIDAPPGHVEFRPEFAQARWVGTTIELPIDVLVDGNSIAKPIVRYVLRRDLIQENQEMARQVDDFPGGQRPRLRPQAETIVQDVRKYETPLANAAVAKDGKVRLLIDSGPVRVEAEGIALADAGLGETVNVRRANGLADVRGRAIDRGTVLVGEN